MKKLLLLTLLLVSPLMGRENTEEVSKTQEKTTPQITDTVSFALTTSFVGAGYFKGNVGLLSQISLEMFAGSPESRSYFYNIIRVVTPIISPTPNNVFTGTSFITGIGYGNWVYKKLDSNQKGWAINLNIALIVDVYNSYVAEENRGHLNGWISGLGITANMRAIYQLNRNFGFVIGTDISYYIPWFATGLDTVHGLTGGLTMGIAF